LIEAVRDTNIPVIISTTDPEVRRSIEPLPNVIVLGAPEPAFAQLQAAAEFVVIPMVHTGLKGGGEANFCNAMWHGKPVIAADSIAAADYIIEGETGYVVPSGDAGVLRTRILELWNTPDLAAEMGQTARIHAVENFCHSAFIRRLLALTLLL
jgi:glycosyltransferase involved in cell wall biosynthesis